MILEMMLAMMWKEKERRIYDIPRYYLRSVVVIIITENYYHDLVASNLTKKKERAGGMRGELTRNTQRQWKSRGQWGKV